MRVGWVSKHVQLIRIRVLNQVLYFEPADGSHLSSSIVWGVLEKSASSVRSSAFSARAEL